MRTRRTVVSALGFGLVALASAGGCTGTIGGDDPVAVSVTADMGPSGLRRLTQAEYDDTLADLLGDTTRPAETALPPDTDTPFDNDFTSQNPSTALIEGAEMSASVAATRAMSDVARRDAIVGCTPAGPNDSDCMRAFVTRFGRRVFRRPLADDEVERFAALQAYAVEANDFYAGAALVIQALLQEPEFLYQTEIGSRVPGRPGLYRLNDFEIATRLSYFLTGSTPSDTLLDLAAAGKLATSDGRSAAASTLVGDPRTRARIERFHALWLGYQSLPEAPDVSAAMQLESSALVDRIVFDEQRDYLDLLRFDETYVGDALAQHYGLQPPGSIAPAWVSYAGTKRLGILSHGSVLSANQKFVDTSPVQRGYYVRVRLMCDTIPPPPPNVNTDMPPMTMATCKRDRYLAHEYGGCASCHKRMDPIGFGLENYDKTGAYRAHDDGAPECAITGDGEVAEVGTFNGPAGLGQLLIDAGRFEPCAVQQVVRFALGRKVASVDQPMLDALVARFDKDRRFDALLVDFVASEAFALRRNEGE